MHVNRTYSLLDRPICRQVDLGFTYITLIFFVAVISVVSLTTVQIGTLISRRWVEEELLEVGNEFRAALLSYANATPAGQSRMPSSLQDLLKDPRYPGTRRHLRKIYVDPIRGKAEWGIVNGPGGVGIIGIYSLSDAIPIKIDNFAPPYQEFSGKNSYREWRFLSFPILPQPQRRTN